MSKTNLNYMYGVMCESDMGLDPFGNPIGKPILMEGVGDNLSQHAAINIAKQLKSNGRFGNVKVVRLEVCEYILD